MDIMSEKKRNTCTYIFLNKMSWFPLFKKKMASDNERARKKERKRERKSKKKEREKTWLLITSRKCYI